MRKTVVSITIFVLLCFFSFIAVVGCGAGGGENATTTITGGTGTPTGSPTATPTASPTASPTGSPTPTPTATIDPVGSATLSLIKTGIGVNDFWLAPNGDIFVVGNGGAIIRYNTTLKRWIPMCNGMDKLHKLYAVWGTSDRNVYACGGSTTNNVDTGVIIHYDGNAENTWTTVNTSQVILRDIAGAAENLIFCVGGKNPVYSGGSVTETGEMTILRYDGTAWNNEVIVNDMAPEQFIGATLRGVWTNPYPEYVMEAYVVGDLGTIVYWNGFEWFVIERMGNQVYKGELAPYHYFSKVWAVSGPSSGQGNVYVTGYFNASNFLLKGNALGFVDFSPSLGAVDRQLNDIWGYDSDNVFIGTSQGDVLKSTNGYTGAPTAINVSTNPIVSISGQSSENIYTMSSFNEIFHSDDEGATWDNSLSLYLTSGFIYGVWGTGENNAYCVGRGGFIGKWDGTDWTAEASPTAEFLYGVWGTSDDNIWAVGLNGTILHHTTAGGWVADAQSGVVTTQNLYSVWGSAANDVWAVGDGGAILHYNGTTWTKIPVAQLPRVVNMHGVWGTSASNVYFVGDDGTIISYNGTAYSEATSNTTSGLWGIWGTGANDIFAVGNSGAVVHYDGTAWTVLDSGISINLRNVWGSNALGVFAYGYCSKLYRYDRSSWSAVNGCFPVSWYGMWGDDGLDSTRGFVVGDFGSILRFDANATD